MHQTQRAFIQFAGVMSMGSASTLLMLRTIAVWNRATFITVPLIVASLGQWGILFHGIVAVRSKRSHAVNACVDHAGPLVFVESMYLYSESDFSHYTVWPETRRSTLILSAAMLFDFIVLVLTTIGLAMSPRRSSLWQLLFRQGIIYFLIAFVANLIPTMFFLLNLNSTYFSFPLNLMMIVTLTAARILPYWDIAMMNRMFTLPGVAAASIVSCRLFISLNTFQQQNVYVNAARPQPPIRLHHAAISSGVVKQARTGVGDDNNNQKRTMGNTIAGIAFRIMSEGVDSMGEVHSMDGPNAATTTSAVLDLKPTYDFKKTSESGEVVVHIETTMHGSDGAPGENHANSTDLEKGESLSHGSASGQNSFESGVAV